MTKEYTTWNNYGRGELGHFHHVKDLRSSDQGHTTMVVREEATGTINAVPNSTYILMNTGISNFVLPASADCTVGDTIEIKSINGVASVSTTSGTDVIFTSFDTPVNEFQGLQTPSSNPITQVASSLDGRIILITKDDEGVYSSFDGGETFDQQIFFPLTGSQAYSSISMDTSGTKVLITVAEWQNVPSNVVVGDIDTSANTVSWTKVSTFADDNVDWTCSTIAENYMVIGGDSMLYVYSSSTEEWGPIELVDSHPWTNVSVNESGYLLAVAKDGTVNAIDLSTGVFSPEWSRPISTLPEDQEWTACYVVNTDEITNLLFATADTVYIFSNGEWAGTSPGIHGIFQLYSTFNTIHCVGRDGIAALGNTFFLDFKWIRQNTFFTTNSVAFTRDSDDNIGYIAASQYITTLLMKGRSYHAPSTTGTMFLMTGDKLILTYGGEEQFIVTENYGKVFAGNLLMWG